MPQLLNYKCCTNPNFVSEFDIWTSDITGKMLLLLSDKDKQMVISSIKGDSKSSNSLSRLINDMIYLYGILSLEKHYGDDSLFSDIQEIKDCAYNNFICRNINISQLF